MNKRSVNQFIVYQIPAANTTTSSIDVSLVPQIPFPVSSVTASFQIVYNATGFGDTCNTSCMLFVPSLSVHPLAISSGFQNNVFNSFTTKFADPIYIQSQLLNLRFVDAVSQTAAFKFINTGQVMICLQFNE